MVAALAPPTPRAHLAQMTQPTSAVPPAPRTYPGVNWIGVRTLYLREVRRFWKVGLQTVAAPVVTTLLYMMVFVVAVGGARPAIQGVSFAEFVAPGLIMMAILNNAFANASSSLIQAKIMGTASRKIAFLILVWVRSISLPAMASFKRLKNDFTVCFAIFEKNWR